MNKVCQPVKTQVPVILVIMDGWGIGKPGKWNAISNAKTPNYRWLQKSFPSTTIKAAGKDVGLATGQAGNSEAGHINIGAGRIVLQDAIHISRAISDGSFFRNTAFQRAVRHVRKHNSTLHLMGMLGNSQSAHANPDHLLALLSFATLLKLPRLAVHLFTDGRDSPRFSAIKMLRQLEKTIDTQHIASIAGRYYAMDRALHWGRVERVYNMLTLGTGLRSTSPDSSIMEAYNRNESDEFIQPTIITHDHEPPVTVKDNDSIIFFNLRSDRARQLTKAFVQPDFTGFKRKKVIKDLVFVAMTDFGPDLPGVLSAFPSQDLNNTLPIALKAFRQIYISESEKYAHMTYFFNGGYDHAVAGEDRVLIPSPKVATYDLRPGMSTMKIVQAVRQDLKVKAHDFIAVNFAAPDMVAHTGHFRASVRAVEIVDKALGEIARLVLKEKGVMAITADHGNIEELKNPKTGEVDTEHSNNPVPFILVGNLLRHHHLRKIGRLADIAPTILHLMNTPQPEEMTGRSLLCD